MIEIYKGAAPNDKTGTPARTAAQIINDNFKYLENKINRKDGIVESTGYSGTPEDKIMNPYWKWIIDTIDYTNPSPVTINFPLAASGKMRLDMIALTTSNAPVRIPGPESDSNPVSEALPDNMVQAGLVLVTDSEVGDPTAPILGTNYVEKQESSETTVTAPGAANVQFSLPVSAIRYKGSATTQSGVYLFPGYNAYQGKKLTVKNFQSIDITLKHLDPVYDPNVNTKFYFSTLTDFVLKPGQIVEFSLNVLENRFEFVGSASAVDVSGKEDKSNKTGTVVGNEASNTLYLHIAGAIAHFQQKLTDSVFGAFINSLTSKTTPVDTDYDIIMDSADSNKAKKVSFANRKATLKTYFDGIYAVPQITITTSVSITNATNDSSGYGQNGRNVIIDNGSSVINYTINGALTTSFMKKGTGAITFVQGSGRTLVQVDGTAIFNGAVGSTATITSVGAIDYLRISNA